MLILLGCSVWVCTFKVSCLLHQLAFKYKEISSLLINLLISSVLSTDTSDIKSCFIICFCVFWILILFYCRLCKSWLMRNLKVLSICGHHHFKREFQQHGMTLSNFLEQKTNLRLFCRLCKLLFLFPSVHTHLSFHTLVYKCIYIHTHTRAHIVQLLLLFFLVCNLAMSEWRIDDSKFSIDNCCENVEYE